MPPHQRKTLSIPLVTYQNEKGFKLHEQALNFLSTVPSHKKCHILSIVGKVKTGKSYLLNKLIHLFKHEPAHQEEYFPMSNHLNDCTRGINLLTSWIQTSDSVILVLDVEGLGSLNNTAQYDSKLFAIALMLSSTIVYNNVGPIDQQALQNLSFLIEIGKLFDKSVQENTKGLLGLPSLFMVLRDFSLTLENKSGIVVTSKQYMEDSLEEQKGISQVITHKNRIRRIIKSLFVSRNCQTMILPSEELPVTFTSEVRQEFLQDLQRLSVKLLAMIRQNPKASNNQLLYCPDYILYIKQFMSTFNASETSIPRFQNILVQVYRKQTNILKESFAKQIAQICRSFDDKIDIINNKIAYILNNKYIEEQVIDQEEMNIIQKMVGDFETMMGEIQKKYEKVCKDMEQLLKKQGTLEAGVTVNYQNSSSMSKQFRDLHELKKEKEIQINKKIEELTGFLANERKNMKEKQECQQQSKKFKQIAEDLCLIQSEKELQKRYLDFMTSLKFKEKHINSFVFENNLLKLQVTYLRRKMQLRERKQTSNCNKCTQPKPLEKPALQNVTNTNQQNYKQQSNSKSHQFRSPTINPLQTFTSKQIAPFNETLMQKEFFASSNNKFNSLQFDRNQPFQNNKSFYVPYLLIEDVSSMNVEIIRTLIKQDTRRNNYIEYVLEVVLLNRRWIFNRKWKDFCQLNNILHNLFSEESLPVFEPSVVKAGEDASFFKKQEIELRRHKLQQYLRNLFAIDPIRNSRIMQKFLKINKEYITNL